MHEVLFIRGLKPTLNVQSDSVGSFTILYVFRSVYGKIGKLGLIQILDILANTWCSLNSLLLQTVIPRLWANVDLVTAQFHYWNRNWVISLGLWPMLRDFWPSMPTIINKVKKKNAKHNWNHEANPSVFTARNDIYASEFFMSAQCVTGWSRRSSTRLNRFRNTLYTGQWDASASLRITN